ncbi:pep-cterm sorting domain-containing protein [Anaeramoeba ignava]|uniref:Pep-cterm sorting domain-containing protein n=1 Tax=Anaeramoeba ignava TaxID=1746090 RepID=A0A9Q0RAX7_ANAIG|nr:pep-cterm sorting domain-containing protein [Anaeramoeba ignava]
MSNLIKNKENDLKSDSKKKHKKHKKHKKENDLNILKLYVSENLSNLITIYLGQGSEKVICSKIILYQNSIFFYRLFKKQNWIQEYHFPELKLQLFQKILIFFETSKIKVDKNETIDLWITSYKLEIEKLIEKMNGKIIKLIESKTVIEIYLKAQEINSEKVIDHSLGFMYNSVEEIIDNPDIVNLSEKAIVNIIKKLRRSSDKKKEIILYKFIINWIKLSNSQKTIIKYWKRKQKYFELVNKILNFLFPDKIPDEIISEFHKDSFWKKDLNFQDRDIHFLFSKKRQINIQYQEELNINIIPENISNKTIPNQFEKPKNQNKFEKPKNENKFKKPKNENEFEKPKNQNEFEKPKNEKIQKLKNEKIQKPKNENIQNEFEKPKNEIEFEKPKNENKFEKPKNENKFEKPKNENQMIQSNFEKPKNENKFEKPKNENQMIQSNFEKPKNENKFEKPKNENEFEKPKNEIEIEKPKTKNQMIQSNFETPKNRNDEKSVVDHSKQTSDNKKYKFPECFIKSKILKENESEDWITRLKMWIDNQDLFDSFIPSLSYERKNKKDKIEGLNFHATCDDRGPCLIIIKTMNGYIFGGFTKLGWISDPERWDKTNKHSLANYGEIKDEDAFLFTFKNPKKYPIEQFPANPEQNQIIYDSRCGPNFGDLEIDDELMSGDSKNFGTAYSPPEIKNKKKLKGFLAKKQSWEISILEIYLTKKIY